LAKVEKQAAADVIVVESDEEEVAEVHDTRQRR
jgi:hypothetical protein